MIHHTSNETTARSIATLTRREPHVDETPIIGPRGRFSFRGRTVYLSERNAILAGVFVYHFGAEVSDVELPTVLARRRHPPHASVATAPTRAPSSSALGLTIFDSGYRWSALRPRRNSSEVGRGARGSVDERLAVAPKSDPGPDQLDDAERPGAGQEAVDAGQHASDGEAQHEDAPSALECVHARQ